MEKEVKEKVAEFESVETTEVKTEKKKGINWKKVKKVGIFLGKTALVVGAGIGIYKAGKHRGQKDGFGLGCGLCTLEEKVPESKKDQVSSQIGYDLRKVGEAKEEYVNNLRQSENYRSWFDE